MLRDLKRQLKMRHFCLCVNIFMFFCYSSTMIYLVVLFE